MGIHLPDRQVQLCPEVLATGVRINELPLDQPFANSGESLPYLVADPLRVHVQNGQVRLKCNRDGECVIKVSIVRAGQRGGMDDDVEHSGRAPGPLASLAFFLTLLHSHDSNKA